MRVLLVNAPLRSVVCDVGVGGHQMPLGLLMVGGPLRDAGHEVTLLDAAREHLSSAAVARRTVSLQPDVVMTSHVGSTQAHPAALRTLAAIRRVLPGVTTVYGGVHPSYHYETVLSEHAQVDVVARGEGEATAVDLVGALADGRDLATVPGIAYRAGGRVRLNTARRPIVDLDAFRIGWELIEDWDVYRAFGLGRAAVVQLSRGCPHACSYCGQWMFWRKWRYRDVGRFVDELEWLRRERDVRFFWLADENPTTIREVWAETLRRIAERNLGTGMCASIRAQDIVRDADILHLYKAAGFMYVLMGVEAVTDERLQAIRKGSTVDDAFRAVRLLREHGILSIVDYIFGFPDESAASVRRAFQGLHRYDGDFVNALYLTPHAWTPLGRDLRDAPVVEHDPWKWDYRHQVLAVRQLTPSQLFAGVKVVELAYHLHPRRLVRLVRLRDPMVRRLLRWSLVHTSLVFLAEIAEHLGDRLRRRDAVVTRPAT